MSAPAKVLREALDMVTQILPEAATMRPDYAKKLRSLLYVALAHAEMNSDRDAARYRAIRTLLDAGKWSDFPIVRPPKDEKYITPDGLDAALDKLIAEGTP